MRVALIGSILLVSAAGVARADRAPADLQQQGEDLAKQGRFSEAIDRFKAADKAQPTATHACLIALAYTRRELWPQAEVWLSLCQVRATPKDPLPDWAAAEQDEINQRLAAANVAPVDIVVEPAGAGAKLTVSSFAPDEQFSPRTIHLPPGMHQIIASAPGFKDQQKLVDIKDKTPVHVVMTLEKPDDGKPTGPPSPGPSTTRGRGLMIGGAVAIGAGIVAYGVMGYGWSQLKDGDPKNFGGASEAMYDYGRIGSISLWAVGAGLVITGYVLHSQHHDEAPAVGLAPTRGGGMVSLGWSR